MFHFRLQQLLKLRERERDASAQAHKQALAALSELQRRLGELQSQQQQQAAIRALSGVAAVDPQRLLEAQRYQMHLAQQSSAVQANIELVEAECKKRQQHLVHKEQAVRILEKLRDKQLAAWTAEQQRQLQFASDEWAALQYWHKQLEAERGI